MARSEHGRESGSAMATALKVRFRAQGNVDWQPGVAVARRGSKLLISYRIQSGAARERWISPNRYEVVEGDAAALPVIAAEKNARAFKVTLPDGRVSRINGVRDQGRPAGVSYSLTRRFVPTEGEAGAWGPPNYAFTTRADGDAYVTEHFSGARYTNGRDEWAVVEVREQ